jgi:outer membrane autotransporter protein
VLLPYARIEFQHVAQSNVKNVFIVGSTVPVEVLGQDKSFGNFAVGASAIFAKGFSAFFNYEQLFGKDNFSDQKYTLGVRVDF